MNWIGRYCDGIFFLVHDLVDPRMYDLARKHPKCAGIRLWTKNFNNHAQLQYCLNWASEIRPKYVLEFDEDEIPPIRFPEVFRDFKASSADTLWFKGVWSYNELGNIAIEPMRRYFFHMKAYKWSEYRAAQRRAGFCAFVGLTSKSIDAFKSRFPLIHLAFLTQELRDRRMLVGNSRSQMYDHTAWFMADNVETVPYDRNKTNNDWIKLWRETIYNNSQPQ